MAVTPNYSWPVPVNTDYVKDGAEAIKDLGDAIDATVFGLPSGGMTLLSTTTLSGASTTVSSISQAYTNLEIWVYGQTNASSDAGTQIRPNAATNLVFNTGTSNNNGTFGTVGQTDTVIQSNQAYARNDANNFTMARISNYTSSTNFKGLSYINGYLRDNSTYNVTQYSGVIRTNTAISSLVFIKDGSQTWLTGTVKIWGM